MKKILIIPILALLFSCQEQTEKKEQISENKDTTLIIKAEVKTEQTKNVSIKNLDLKPVNIDSLSLEIEKKLIYDNISNRPLKLAKYLETAAKYIKHYDSYNWQDMSKCNVGVLAQFSTSLKQEQLKQHLHKYTNKDQESWTTFTDTQCPATGLNITDIHEALFKIGMRREDIYHIEYLSNKEIISKCNFKEEHDYTNKEDVSKYMETWAAMIRKYHINKSVRKININKVVIAAQAEGK
jgi:hypothetical protein